MLITTFYTDLVKNLHDFFRIYILLFLRRSCLKMTFAFMHQKTASVFYRITKIMGDHDRCDFLFPYHPDQSAA